jgi:argininosuccinate lyase
VFELLIATGRLLDAFIQVVETVDFNRAYFANRAGRGLSTSGDLAYFLMEEEQIDPASARKTATMAARRAREEGIEASGFTADLIDSAALLVIGREIKPEFERMNRYLAPRRFVERRTSLGAASPASTRAYLVRQRSKAKAEGDWITARIETLRAIQTRRIPAADGVAAT